MGMLEAITLGAVQGFTEFLPISSTGHLILAREVLGLTMEYSLAVDAVLHLATAFAVLIYFRSDFLRLAVVAWQWASRRQAPQTLQYTGGSAGISADEKRDRNLILALVLGTAPAVALGILFEDYVATVVRSADVVAGALIVGSAVFLLAEHIGRRNADRDVSPRMGLRIGFFQALALVPGMSRSGMAISGGLLFGLTREEAARFAFLLSLPIILGAGMLSAVTLGINGILSELGFALVASALAAFATGWLSIHYLLRYLRSHTLGIFVVYRLALAAIILLFL